MGWSQTTHFQCHSVHKGSYRPVVLLLGRASIQLIRRVLNLFILFKQWVNLVPSVIFVLVEISAARSDHESFGAIDEADTVWKRFTTIVTQSGYSRPSCVGNEIAKSLRASQICRNILEEHSRITRRSPVWACLIKL